MARGLFVTGTDTGVGKTVVSAGLVLRCRSVGPLQYWKPIQTGIEQDDDTAEVTRLARLAPPEVRRDGVRLPKPVSPHLAAALAGTRIDLADLTLDAAPRATRHVVEGAGGVLVPVNERDLMLDLMVQLGLPVVVAARASLGTINHTLLTLMALRSRRLTVAGVVMVGEPNADNRRAIERYGDVAVLGELPRLEPLTAATLEAWAVAHLDPADRLAEYLT